MARRIEESSSLWTGRSHIICINGDGKQGEHVPPSRVQKFAHSLLSLIYRGNSAEKYGRRTCGN
jgi:hypothetical protein